MEEYVPGRRFYAVFVVSLAASLSLGLHVAFRVEWKAATWPSVWLWLLAALVAGVVIPDLTQYAALRRFGARPRRVGWIERGSGPLVAWWRAPDHWLTGPQFGIAYGVPALISCGVFSACVARFPTAAPVFCLLVPFYLGNLWCALIVILRPGRTLVQPFGRGLRLRAPPVRSP